MGDGGLEAEGPGGEADENWDPVGRCIAASALSHLWGEQVLPPWPSAYLPHGYKSF